MRAAVSLGGLKRRENKLSIEPLDDVRVRAVMENGPMLCEHDGFGDGHGFGVSGKCTM